MIYEIKLSDRVKEDLVRLAKMSQKPLRRQALSFIEELRIHPKSKGMGHPEPLKGKPENRWSREITKKHRLVYIIFEKEVHVDVLAAYGHYDDK